MIATLVGLCNGSTQDSGSCCEGSNPSPTEKKVGYVSHTLQCAANITYLLYF